MSADFENATTKLFQEMAADAVARSLHGRTGMQPIGDVETWMWTPPAPAAVFPNISSPNRTTGRAHFLSEGPLPA
jgi:hypothetical protein